MLKSCKYCGGIHEEDYICAAAPVKKKKTTQASRFRSTSKWQAKSAERMAFDMFLCRECLFNRIINSKKLSVHHIVPLEVDFSRRLDDDNLITLCSLDHKKAERGEISAQHLAELAKNPPLLR